MPSKSNTSAIRSAGVYLGNETPLIGDIVAPDTDHPEEDDRGTVLGPTDHGMMLRVRWERAAETYDECAGGLRLVRRSAR